MVSKGTTFTVLWSEVANVWHYYGMDSTSDFLLLDRFGNRLTEKTAPFDREVVEALLDELS